MALMGLGDNYPSIWYGMAVNVYQSGRKRLDSNPQRTLFVYLLRYKNTQKCSQKTENIWFTIKNTYIKNTSKQHKVLKMTQITQ